MNENKRENYSTLIDWCLTPTSAVFQLYRGVKKLYKFYKLIYSTTIPLEIHIG